MLKYQIRFCDKRGCGSFEYIEVKSIKGVEKKAAEKATEYINKRKGRDNEQSWNPFVALNPFKPQRVVHVWEWDSEEGEPKKKGHRFKLELFYVQATLHNGRKARDEWYEPVIETKAAKS